jgi:hypothetical protein
MSQANPVCNWHLQQLNLNTADHAVFHVPFPFDPNFESKIKHAVTCYDQVVILCSELHRVTVDFIKANQYPNLIYFTCGRIQGVQSYLWMDWFITPVQFYSNHIELLDKLNPYTAKKFHFDILLGCTRPHREVVYNYVTQQQINQTAIMSYYRYAHLPLLNNVNFINEPGVEFTENVTHSVGLVKYMGEVTTLSKVIPISVYNQSAYSVVTETNAENDFVFYTEKITKPILAERLFIVLAGYNYLKNLRSLGFKTFDCVVDESYDEEPDNFKRYNMACEQILKLSQLPQQEVLDKIKPIVKHNREVMLGTDWLGDFHRELRTALMQTK